MVRSTYGFMWRDRRVLEFLGASVAGRLCFSMLPLGIVLFSRDASGSIAVAGAAAGRFRADERGVIPPARPPGRPVGLARARWSVGRVRTGTGRVPGDRRGGRVTGGDRRARRGGGCSRAPDRGRGTRRVGHGLPRARPRAARALLGRHRARRGSPGRRSTARGGRGGDRVRRGGGGRGGGRDRRRWRCRRPVEARSHVGSAVRRAGDRRLGRAASAAGPRSCWLRSPARPPPSAAWR